MIYEVSVYDASGRITLTAELSQSTYELYKSSGYAVVEEISDPALHYVSGGVVVERPANLTTISGTTLSNLPSPCKIVINGASYDCTDTSATLSFDTPGVYNIAVVAWPYLDASFQITI